MKRKNKAVTVEGEGGGAPSRSLRRTQAPLLAALAIASGLCGTAGSMVYSEVFEDPSSASSTAEVKTATFNIDVLHWKDNKVNCNDRPSWEDAKASVKSYKKTLPVGSTYLKKNGEGFSIDESFLEDYLPKSNPGCYYINYNLTFDGDADGPGGSINGSLKSL